MARGYSMNSDGDVVLTMSRDDFDVLLMATGSAMAISRSDRGVPISLLIPVMNRIMQGSPDWTPYQERKQ